MPTIENGDVQKAVKFTKPMMGKLMDECQQGPVTRRPLYDALEQIFQGKAVVNYCTSFSQPVIMNHVDVDLIENVLQSIDLSNGLVLIINSPGGSGLAAERIITVCRSYSKGNFEVIVPRMAKSAATMVAFGANSIWMSETSELGPIDPQVVIEDTQISVHNIVSSYEELMRKAIACKGRIDPYMLQLSQYQASQIAQLKDSQFVAEDIAIQALKTGMMKGKTAAKIKNSIKPFTDASLTGSHGRRIGIKSAKQCGLKVNQLDLDSEAWKLLWELYIRTDWCLKSLCSKMVESKRSSFTASFVGRKSGGSHEKQSQ